MSNKSGPGWWETVEGWKPENMRPQCGTCRKWRQGVGDDDAWYNSNARWGECCLAFPKKPALETERCPHWDGLYVLEPARLESLRRLADAADAVLAHERLGNRSAMDPALRELIAALRKFHERASDD